jgi:hypothetical protein
MYDVITDFTLLYFLMLCILLLCAT